ncbi:MAG: hypothetical protein CL484_12920 [Acidobacteria bacterium]|nr:hypothetical protein [Acidobacteriota bacterium]
MTHRAALCLATTIIFAVPVVRALLWHPLSISEVTLSEKFARVSGLAHVHTTYSDGSGTLEDVQLAAAASNADFLIVTDHNTLSGKAKEGYNDTGLLTIIGSEISINEGHILAVGLPVQPYRFSADGLDTLEDIHGSHGLAFAAHPEHPRNGLRWTGWELPGDWGIEVVNGDTQWRTAGLINLVFSTLMYPFNPTYALLRLMSRPSALQAWDQTLHTRHTTALAGADAHGPQQIAGPLRLPLPSYKTLFGLVKNHVLIDQPLSGSAVPDIDAILNALRQGRSYIGIDGLASADRFYFVAESEGRTGTMGETFAPANDLLLKAGGALPAAAIVRLLRNGQEVAASPPPLELSTSETGVYRIEVDLPGWPIPWILSNPIYIFGEQTQNKRAQASRMPDPIERQAAIILDNFETGTTFETVSDETSTVNSLTTTPGSGPDGSFAAHIDFELGTPTPDNPSPFASLVSNGTRNLSSFQGLVFSVKSDRTYRFTLQLRDKNTRAPEQREIWSASVKSTATWTQVTLPFSRLRSVSPQTDGRFDPDATEAIVFLVDLGGVAPGTAGTIWIDNLGVY